MQTPASKSIYMRANGRLSAPSPSLRVIIIIAKRFFRVHFTFYMHKFSLNLVPNKITRRGHLFRECVCVRVCVTIFGEIIMGKVEVKDMRFRPGVWMPVVAGYRQRCSHKLCYYEAFWSRLSDVWVCVWRGSSILIRASMEKWLIIGDAVGRGGDGILKG